MAEFHRSNAQGKKINLLKLDKNHQRIKPFMAVQPESREDSLLFYMQKVVNLRKLI